MRCSGQELERLAVAVRALAGDALRGEVGDHGEPPPLLALVHVGQVHLDDRLREQLDGVVDRPAVVRPRRRVEDDAVGHVERLVQPVDVRALVVRLAAADGQAELLAPRVEPRLELAKRERPVDGRIAPAELVQVDAVQHVHAHARTLGDERFERPPHVGVRELDPAHRLPGRLEQDELDAARLDLLVAAERRPGPLDVDARRAAAPARASASSATAASRPRCSTESRSAARRPSATACAVRDRRRSRRRPRARGRTCGPRLSTARSPRSCGSRRQTAVL